MKRNTDYKNDALAALKGNWGKAVLATVIFMAVMYLTVYVQYGQAADLYP